MAATWRQKQAERLKDLIYNTALELFRERGYESTSVDRITARAGVAKGTFFNHFPSKDHVLALWYEEITLAILRKCRAAKHGSAEAAVLDLASGLAEAGMRDAALYASKSRNWSETVSGEEEKLDAELLRYLREQLEGGRGRGELSSSLDVDFFAGLILAVLTGTAKNWVVAGCAFDLKRAIEARVRFLFVAGKGWGKGDGG
jgi:AcrR family transcriptional regulator